MRSWLGTPSKDCEWNDATFFAAGHIHYAQYALYYLHSIYSMPEEVHKHFQDGEHTVHHTSGHFNGIWSDMVIETTFMRYGVCPNFECLRF